MHSELKKLVEHIKSTIVPHARELREAEQMIPVAFFYRAGQRQAYTQLLSDQPTFHDHEHKRIAAAMVTAAARKVGATALLVVVDTDFWRFHPNAHELVGMGKAEFMRRVEADYEWLCSVRDTVGDHKEAISFRLESLFGDWSATLCYQRHERYGYVWEPLHEEPIDALAVTGNFANLFPPPTTQAQA